MFKSGLLSVTFRNKSPESIISLVVESGLQSIEWGGDVHVMAGDTCSARRIGEITRDAGLAVSAYGSYYRFCDIDPHSEDQGPEMEAVLDSAEALGAEMIRIWPGNVGSREASSDWRWRVVERSIEFAELAENRGISLGFEFHDNSLTDTADSTRKLLSEINRPNVSTFWQTNRGVSHEAHLNGLKLLRDSISNIHCHHLVDYLTPPFELIEHGEKEWMEYLDVLDGSGRDHWISLEFVKDGTEESFWRDAKTLKRWCLTRRSVTN